MFHRAIPPLGTVLMPFLGCILFAVFLNSFLDFERFIFLRMIGISF